YSTLSLRVCRVCVISIYYCVPGSLAQWTVWMPKDISTMRNSCVVIPCTFMYPSNVRPYGVHGIWYFGQPYPELYPPVVFKSRTEIVHESFKDRTKLLGDLKQRNCTLQISNIGMEHSGKYYFRADLGSSNVYTYPDFSEVKVLDSPDRPAISPSSAVKEGALTSLACTAPAPCPREPPALVWSDTLNGSVEIEQVEQQDGTKAVSSVLTFTASHLHHNKDITCTAQYPVGSETKSAGEVSTLRVLYSPKNTLALISPPGEIHEGGHVTLSCSSNANPAVSRYTWFEVKGDNINEKGVEQYLTFTDINASDSGLYYCEARNEHGAENSTAVQLNVVCMYL
ncbi:myelin-associated glycoprotein-like, partial [Acipenser oxyrinchus oxyrinchus]